MSSPYEDDEMPFLQPAIGKTDNIITRDSHLSASEANNNFSAYLPCKILIKTIQSFSTLIYDKNPKRFHLFRGELA